MRGQLLFLDSEKPLDSGKSCKKTFVSARAADSPLPRRKQYLAGNNMAFVCLHFANYTCTNTVEVKDTLCSQCERGKCGQPGISCSKNRHLYRAD
ncbi:hypothetical protein VTH06DRAFT_553 [Thermothelomyces fergusii]